ncbi:MAG: type IX secretion system membrane protein PorP/SprF [Chitinophagaceae bacterium]|nr:type IX secretion system membrane protein PorP/SprF [Chitinophagaceae bacterium]
MNVKKFLTAVLLLGALNTIAQQRPYYTQYIMNNFIVNPAMAGIENYTDVKISHRAQWVGLDGAPVTTYFTIHAPLKKSDYDRETATSFHRAGFNPRGQAYWQDYTAPENHGGIGFTILNDRTGPLNNFGATATYAYHIGIGPHTTLSAGLSAGITNLRLDASKLQFNTPVDPAVAGSGYLNNVRPDISAGLWLYDRDFFLGLAAQQIVPQKIVYNTNGVGLEQGKLVPHMFLSAGYRMFLSDDVTFLPSTTVRYVSPLPIGLDINAKFQYQDLVWAGASYRLDDGYAAMLGVNISSTLNVGYSYDFTTSRLNTVSKGSHEIVIGFQLGNKYGDWCPRNNY